MIIIDKQGRLASDVSVQELNEFAKTIGLKRSWYRQGVIPHYEVKAHMSMLARKYGAESVDSSEFNRRAKR